MLSFKPTFSLSTFTFIKRLFSSSSLSAIRVVSWHARPDGQTRWLDHRDAHHREFPRGPECAAVLHRHARRPQGPGRYGPEDGQLWLPDAPPGGRDPGPGGHRGRLRHLQWLADARHRRGR